jgi:hypothetical protein
VTVIVVPPLLSDDASVVTAWVLHGASTEVAVGVWIPPAVDGGGNARFEKPAPPSIAGDPAVMW